MPVLKYNWTIIGHEKQLRQIEKDIESGNLSHAYLMVGADSIGKFSVAKRMAGILQCSNNFCQQCPTCVQVKNGSHVDTIEFLDGESIGIDAVRELVARLNMTPQSNYKITLIDHMERMTVEAANSFLKILEEPPSKTIFIMTCNRIDALPETIISRVRVVKFNNVSPDYLREELKKIYAEADEETLEKVCVFSLGKTGKAVDLMDSPEMLADYMRMYNDILIFLESKNVADAFSYAENLSEDKKKIEMFMEIFSHILRSKLLSGHEDKGKIMESLWKINEAGILLKKNVNTRLVLENLMLSI